LDFFIELADFGGEKTGRTVFGRKNHPQKSKNPLSFGARHCFFPKYSEKRPRGVLAPRAGWTGGGGAPYMRMRDREMNSDAH
jgi:hypothetical protein